MKKKKTGVKPDALKIEGDWEEAMSKAIKKDKPKVGWSEKDKSPEKDKSNEK